MLEIAVSVNAPALAEAMNALAAALQLTNFAPIQTGAEVIPPPAQLPAPVAPVIPPVATPAPIAPPAVQTPAPAPMVPTVPPSVPVSPAPASTHEMLMKAGATLIDIGKINELMGLLNRFGVQAVTHLKSEQLGAFATEMRQLGAQI